MSITCGYLGGPSGSPSAAPVVVTTPVSGNVGTVVLGQSYYPVDLNGVFGPRPSFDGQPVPYMVRTGTALTLPRAEVNALLATGAVSPA